MSIRSIIQCPGHTGGAPAYLEHHDIYRCSACCLVSGRPPLTALMKDLGMPMLYAKTPSGVPRLGTDSFGALSEI